MDFWITSFSRPALRTWVLFILCSWGTSVLGQYKISGYITDSTSGEKVVGVYILTSHAQVTSTDINGFYSIVLSSIPDTVVFSMIGYVDQHVLIECNDQLNIKLVPKSYSINQVDVVGIKVAREDEIDVVSIPMRRLKNVPNILGERDVMKIISLTPGVASGKEGTSGLFVRGGTPDQNLLLLDGTKIYNSDHLFGYLSVFNPDAIQSFRLYKADFPTKYGGNLSSVVDIKVKDGNKKEKKQEVSIGMISTRLILEGPIKKDTSSYFFAARLGYWSVLSLPSLYQYLKAKKQAKDNVFAPSRSMGVDEKVYLNYLLYDVNGKLDAKFDNNDRFSASIYAGQDFIMTRPFPKAIYGNNKTNLLWGNRMISTQYAHLSKNNIFSNFGINISDYTYKLNNESNIELEYGDDKPSDVLQTKNVSRLTDIGFTNNNTYEFSTYYRLNFGYSFNNHGQKHFFTANKNDSMLYQNEVNTSQLEQSVFIENKVMLSLKWNAKLGIRNTWYSLQEKKVNYLEPRISLSCKANDFNALKISYSKMTQPLHLLPSAAKYDGILADIWISSSTIIPAEESSQWSFGWTNQLDKSNVEIKFEMYYKAYKNLIDFKEGYNFAENPDLYEDNIETNGIGKSYGMELFVNKSEGKFTGWLSYTLSWNRRKFEQINLGDWYDHQYSRRHDMSVTSAYELKKGRKISASFILTSGTRLTLPTRLYFSPNGGVIAVYTERNNYILPTYHRLDFSFTKKVKTRKKKRDAYWTYSIYNVYARQNPSLIYFEQQRLFAANSGTNQIKFDIFQRSIITIFPSISYRIIL